MSHISYKYTPWGPPIGYMGYDHNILPSPTFGHFILGWSWMQHIWSTFIKYHHYQSQCLYVNGISRLDEWIRRGLAVLKTADRSGLAVPRCRCSSAHRRWEPAPSALTSLKVKKLTNSWEIYGNLPSQFSWKPMKWPMKCGFPNLDSRNCWNCPTFGRLRLTQAPAGVRGCRRP